MSSLYQAVVQIPHQKVESILILFLLSTFTLDFNKRKFAPNQVVKDNQTIVTYSIQFYYTPEFAATTPDIPGKSVFTGKSRVLISTFACQDYFLNLIFINSLQKS